MECERCGLYFDKKNVLIQHLKKKSICMPIFSDKNRNDIIDELTNKIEKTFKCDNCNKLYATKYTLIRHQKSCNTLKNTNTKISISNDELLNEIKKLGDQIKELKNVNNPINNTQNTYNTQNNTQNINITINNINDASGKQIEHILSSPFLKDNLLEWIKSKDGLFKYIDYKFFDPEHPENMMIKKGDSKEHIDLHIYGKWKKYENEEASDLILTNVGIDFESYFGVLKYENEEDYRQNKKAILKFKDNIIEPLEWGTDISDDENIVYKGHIEKINGQLYYIDDNENQNKIKNNELLTKVTKHIHLK